MAMVGMCLTLKAQVEKFNTPIANNYVKVFQITTKSGQLASNVRVSATSHAGNHVGNFTANILVNHHKDIFVKTTSGGYTLGTIKIESDNRGSYFMSYKTTSSNEGRYYFTVEALSSEIIIIPLPTGVAPTEIIHEHKTNYGTHESGTEGGTGKILSSSYSGRVGVGTTTPAGLLDVNGGYFSRGQEVIASDGTSSYIKAKGNIYFQNSSNNGVLATMTNTGSFGIGTSAIPTDYKLAIAGKVISEEVKVQLQTNWPDYVFANNYDLPKLTEVESHIKAKGHLKDIPSAEEVKKDGFFLGEMDAKLLQKIEELTLYTIQQEKKIKVLEAEKIKTQQLEKEVEELKALVNKLIQDKK